MAHDWTKLSYQYDTLVAKETVILPDGTLDKDRYRTDLQSKISAQYPHTETLVRHIRDSKTIDTPGTQHVGRLGQICGQILVRHLLYTRYLTGVS